MRLDLGDLLGIKALMFVELIRSSLQQVGAKNKNRIPSRRMFGKAPLNHVTLGCFR